MARKLGSVWGVNISLSAVQTPIRQKQPNFEFHIFAHPNAATLHMPPGAHATLSPLPAATTVAGPMAWNSLPDSLRDRHVLLNAFIRILYSL